MSQYPRPAPTTDPTEAFALPPVPFDVPRTLLGLIDHLNSLPAVVDGEDGREIELRSSDTAVEWRYVGDTSWTVLLELTLLTGPQGPAGVEGPPGEPGPAGQDAQLENIAYRHVQISSSSTWTITHPLTFRPNVMVVDSSGEQVLGRVSYVNESTIVILFSAPFAGEAYLS